MPPTKPTIRTILPLIASSILLPMAPAAAQDDEQGSETATPVEPQNVIVVTGEGLDETPAAPAYSSITLERAQILATPSGRLEDVLGAVAGFQQFRRSDSRSANPTAQGATLRALGGNATSRALVTLDGIPIADPFFGYVPFNSVAPDWLGSIRVTRGGGSGPFGSGALAGTIALESAGYSELAPFEGRILANDRGETESSAILSSRLGAGFVTASGRWDRGKGFFTTPEDQRVPASARASFDNWSFSLRGVAPVTSDIELQANALVYDDRRTLRFEGADSTNEGQNASLRLVGRGAWAFDALAYIQARDFSNVVISSTRFTRVLDQRATPSTGIGGKIELQPPVGDAHVLRIGTDYRRASGNLSEDAYSAFSGALTERRSAGGATSDLGFFLENDWTPRALDGKLVLSGGIRAILTRVTGGFFVRSDPANVVTERLVAPDRSDWSATYRAGVLYRVTDAFALRAAAYSGERVPTLNELYRPFVVFPVETLANADLTNERLEGFEVGFDIVPRAGIELALTAFDNRVEDAIANVTLEENLRQRQNLPAIEARGLEFDLGIDLGLIAFDGTLSYTDAEIEGRGPSLALDGNRPPQVPNFSAAAALSYRPAKDWNIALTLRHVAEQFEDDLETDPLPAATTLGIYAQVPVTDDLQLVFRGENLTDERVVTRNSGGSLDLGAPRTFWAGIRLDLDPR